MGRPHTGLWRDGLSLACVSDQLHKDCRWGPCLRCRQERRGRLMKRSGPQAHGPIPVGCGSPPPGDTHTGCLCPPLALASAPWVSQQLQTLSAPCSWAAFCGRRKAGSWLMNDVQAANEPVLKAQISCQNKDILKFYRQLIFGRGHAAGASLP